MATKNKFPNTMTRYFDSRGAGSITIQGIELDSDEDGFVEAPGGFAKEMIPHGFLPENGPEHMAWKKENPPTAKAKK